MVKGIPQVSAGTPSRSDYSAKGKGLLLLSQSLRVPNFGTQRCSVDDTLQGELPHVAEDTSVFTVC